MATMTTGLASRRITHHQMDIHRMRMPRLSRRGHASQRHQHTRRRRQHTRRHTRRLGRPVVPGMRIIHHYTDPVSVFARVCDCVRVV